MNAHARFNSVACYVVQHDHNPMMFLKSADVASADAITWTTIEGAHRFRSQEHAVRWVNNWRNGKGYALPCIMHRGRPKAAR